MEFVNSVVRLLQNVTRSNLKAETTLTADFERSFLASKILDHQTETDI